MDILEDQILVRRDTLANFIAQSVVPLNGEPVGIIGPDGRATAYKIGDGVSTVDQLPALSKGDKGDTGPQGLPGTNGVATDAAVATNMQDTSTQTGAAFSRGIRQGIADVRSRLSTRAAYDLATSLGKSRVAVEDSDQYLEAWPDLTAWAGAGVQVSGGLAYGSTSQSSGIARSYRIEPGTIARVTFQINYVVGASSGGGVLVGFSKNAVGTAPAVGGAGARGIYIRSDGNTTATSIVKALDNGSQSTDLMGTGTTTMIVTAIADETYLTVTAVNAATGQEVHARWARDDSAFPLNNLTVMVNDTRGTAGSSVGVIAGRRGGLVTTKPRQAYRTAQWGTASGDGFRIALPASYDSRVPTPAVVLFHGNGSDESHWITNGNGTAVDTALLNAGFITIAAANTGATSTWGSDDGLAAYTAAYRYARDHYNIGAVCFYANSMGGIESLNVLARDAIPGVAAWAGTVPTYDLAENRANALFTSTIDTAYAGDYANKAVGHDPAKMDARLFRGIPMWMLIATDDTSVTPAANGQALYTAVSPVAPTTKVEVTGGHSTGQIAARAADIVAFFKGVLGVS
ncbi:hypothetical protein HP467_07165 [Curtobacterium albidum]|uniref:Uncharacterized protein n=1 Tax=Curtobacterium citreum TaxID=2036 RepID=A0A850DSH7_9MICO|nr:hypothetical protein [Curtobacterium albidum]NUU27891.1 hypothetical protein [Curtobacterium albidum]